MVLTNLDRFMCVYEACLRARMASKPQDYAYGPELVPTVLERMRKSFETDGYLIDRQSAWGQACKVFGIKATGQAFREFLASEPPKTYNRPESIFICVMGHGLSYCDTSREVHGDYVVVARLQFDTLQLEWRSVPPSPDWLDYILADARSVQDRRGDQYQVSQSNQTVTLGSAL